MSVATAAPAASPGLSGVLERLDRLLERAAARVPEIHGADAVADRFRGLYVSRSEVARLLARPPGAPLFADLDLGADAPQAAPDRLGWLARAMGLSAFDVDVVLLALAPEVDGRYERIYAYLQDDVTRRRPSVELALNLLCEDAADRLARRWHFSPDAPLLAERIIELTAEAPGAALLAQAIRLDEQIVNLLLEQDVLDRRLAPACRVVPPVPPPPAALLHGEAGGLAARVAQARAAREPLWIELVGPQGSGKRTVASLLAAGAGAELLLLDLARLGEVAGDPERALALAVREAWLRDAVLAVYGADALGDPARGLPPDALREALEDHAGIAIVCSAEPLPAPVALPGALRLTLGVPPEPVRRRLWAGALERRDVAVADDVVAALAGRFRLLPAEIENAAALAAARAALRCEPDGAAAAPVPADLLVAAREQAGDALERLAVRSRPVTGWDELVLPPDQKRQLRELCDRALHGRVVLEEWGFAARLPRGRGITALFAGPSGTGKTMAAEVVAAELGVDLWRIDLAGVVSKYIGETEKNLDRIFRAAESANGVLLFDEAEALFGKRSEVRDSHDRYANIEVAYLLQKMEQFEGIAILATNLRGNLDEAFVRRLAFSIHFPFPDEASRRLIWKRIFPRDTPLADDVDLDRLARDVPLSGGHIRNIALAAAFLAAGAAAPVGMAHLLEATRREYQKLGKTVEVGAPAAGGAA